MSDRQDGPDERDPREVIPQGPPPIDLSRLTPEQIELLRLRNRVGRRLAMGFARPWVTRGMVALITVIHLAVGIRMYLDGKVRILGVLLSPRDLDTLTQMGAMRGIRVSGGEYWRLLSCQLLHGDGMHILLNGVALYALGRLCEAVYGPIRLLWLLLMSGTCGSLLSWAGGNANSVGASGGIFGLLGAAVVFGFRYKRELPEAAGELFRRRLLPWVALNLFIGAVVPFIDNLGHTGGLIGGAVFALLIGNRAVPGEDSGPGMHVLMAAVASSLLGVGLLGVVGAFG